MDVVPVSPLLVGPNVRNSSCSRSSSFPVTAVLDERCLFGSARSQPFPVSTFGPHSRNFCDEHKSVSDEQRSMQLLGFVLEIGRERGVASRRLVFGTADARPNLTLGGLRRLRSAGGWS